MIKLISFSPFFRNSIAASAVCAFNLSAITQAFNGPFRYQENPRSAWLPTLNPIPNFQVMLLPFIYSSPFYVLSLQWVDLYGAHFSRQTHGAGKLYFSTFMSVLVCGTSRHVLLRLWDSWQKMNGFTDNKNVQIFYNNE